MRQRFEPGTKEPQQLGSEQTATRLRGTSSNQTRNLQQQQQQRSQRTKRNWMMRTK